MNPRGGRPPLPANVLRFRGSASKTEIEEREAGEIRPQPIAPRMPKGLSALEQECWRHHAPELERLALLTALDGDSFRVLVCQPYEMIFLARDAMRPRKADGSPDRRRKGLELVIEDHAHRGQLRKHPAWAIWKMSVDEYRAGCREFGLTPSSRVGLRPYGAVGALFDDDEDDDGLEFFGN